MSEAKMSFNHTTVSNSTIIGNKEDTTYNAATAPNSDVLRELQAIQQQLESADPMVADTVKELRMAIEKQEHSKISDNIRKLTSGFATSVITKVASDGLLRYLGIK